MSKHPLNPNRRSNPVTPADYPVSPNRPCALPAPQPPVEPKPLLCSVWDGKQLYEQCMTAEQMTEARDQGHMVQVKTFYR